MTHIYRNLWAKPHEPQEYTRHVEPIEYMGCQLFHVHPEQWDVVKAGSCIAQRVTKSGAMYAAELVEDIHAPTYHDVREWALAVMELGA